MKTHKARKISDDALDGLRTLYEKHELPSDEKKKEETLDVVRWAIEQRKLYTKTFEELTLQEQALSISGQFSSLKQAIKAHGARKAKEGKENEDETWNKWIEQLEKVLADGSIERRPQNLDRGLDEGEVA